MIRKLTSLSLGLALLSAAAPATASASSIFQFQFDNQGLNSSVLNSPGPLDTTIVGTGTFTSPVDLAPGTYDLSALSGFTLDFSFTNGDTFTQADIKTKLTGVAVSVTGSGANELLAFTEGSGLGRDNGPGSGALDLISKGSLLSFEPSFAGGNFAYQVDSNSGNLSGRYMGASLASSPTPEPASFALLLTGMSGLGLAKRRFRR